MYISRINIFRKQNKIVSGKAYKILYCLNICLVVVAIITTTGLTLFSITNETEPYFQMLKNWDHDPIVEFYIPNDNSGVCNSEDTSVFYYKWPGIEGGCQCKNGDQSYNQCCSFSDILDKKKDCCFGYDVTAIPEQEFNFLEIRKSQKKKLSLCAKHLKGYNFHEKHLTSSTCQQNEKMCGGLNKESRDYSFCVPENSECPIQEIYFSDQPVDNADLYPLDLPNTSLNLYVIRSSTQKLPLAQFKVNISLNVCWYDEFEYFSAKSYYFDRRQNLCASFSSTRFSQTNLMNSEKQLYELNLSYNMEKQPAFEYNIDPYYLLQKQYVFIHMSCRDRISSIYDNSENLNTLKKLVLTNFIICIINCIALAVFELIYYDQQKYSSDYDTWEIKLFSYYVKDWYNYGYFIKLIWLLICIGITITINTIYIKQIKFMQDLVDNNCFGEGDMSADIDDLIQSMKSGFVIITIIALVYQLLFTDPNPTSFIFNILKNCCSRSKSYEFTANQPPQIKIIETF